jgi:hypothetical protein
MDLFFRHGANTHIAGFDTLDPERASIELDSGSSSAFGLAPGLEYNWTPKLGVLLAARIILNGHNTRSSLTPALALNMFY